MDNKKSKKKLFAIIGSSVLAFVLTVVVSVAVTLAYFGGSDAEEATMTMGQAVNVNAAVAATGNVENILPGQLVNLDVTAEVAQSTTTSYLAAVVEVSATGDDATEEDIAALLGLVDATDAWDAVEGKHFEGTINGVQFGSTSVVYVLGTTDALTVVNSADKAETYKLVESPVRVSKRLTNTVAEATLTVKVAFISVQSSIEDAASVTVPGFLTTTNWNDAVEEAFELVSGGTIEANA